ncbi:MAG: glycosyltransferase family 4 protein [Actinomycetota bacterium]|nr:glycosyltransferase family 4 protein [Actinomycetota bacterium]
MTAVHQFIPSFAARTAIGTHTREVARLLRSMGVEGHLYVGHARDVGRGEVTPYQQFTPPAGQRPVLLYQLSTGSPMAEYLANRPEPLVVNYHNITPAPLIQAWEPLLAGEMHRGRRELRLLSGRSTLGVAVSAYNQAEMAEAGYDPAALTTVPVLVDYEALASDEDHALTQHLSRAHGGRGATWLFVGRRAASKAQHRLIAALAVHRRLYDPHARLYLVGESTSARYQAALPAYAASLGLADAVIIAGSVPQRQLVSYYRTADVFVSASEHEGFGIPLIEAMGHGVPVVALACAAVGDTVGNAGLLIGPDAGGHASPAVLAAAVNRVLSDRELRASMVRQGRATAAELSIDRTRARMRDALGQVLNG